MTETYLYRALSQGRSIRVMVLQPGRDRDAPLQCNLHEIFLDACREIEKERQRFKESLPTSSNAIIPTMQAAFRYSPDDRAVTVSAEGQKTDRVLGAYRYRALSYVWGSEIGLYALECEGKKIFMTENCDRALRDLRDDTSPITLWVDAICVNQKDLDERAQQVSLMSEIYRYADEVVIWLSEVSGSMASCFSRMPAVDWEILKRHWPRFAARIFFKCFTKDMSIEEIVDLCSNKWATRIWTVQEFYFAYKTAIVCGKSKVSADIFFQWICLVEEIVPRVSAEQLHSIRTGRQRFTSRRVGALTYAFLEMGDSQQKGWAERGSISWRLFFLKALGSAVYTSRANNCSDPRDKIYGVYSLLPRCINELPDINYRRDEFSLYEDFTRATILISGAFWPAAFPISANHNQKLPSWVPDFSLELDDDALRESEANKPFHKTNTTALDRNTVEILPAAEQGTFALKGELLAHIVELDREWSKRAEEWYSCLISWITFFLDRYADSIGDAGTHSPPQAFFNLLFNDLLADVDDVDDVDMDDPDEAKLAQATKTFSSVVRWLINTNQMPRNRAGLFTRWRVKSQAGTISDFLHLVNEQVGSSTIFQTDTGHLGNGFGEAKQHDTIALLTGCNFPVILRKDKGNWRLIGRAFVLGIETGDAWRQRVQLSEMQTFILV